MLLIEACMFVVVDFIYMEFQIVSCIYALQKMHLIVFSHNVLHGFNVKWWTCQPKTVK